MPIEIQFGPQDSSSLRDKEIDASGLSTAQRALIDARVNDACFFSSKVSDAKLLEKMRTYIAEAAEGKRFRGRADFIATMREAMGVKGGKDSGKLTDITSSRRLGLIFDFQQERLSAQIFLAQGEDKDHRWAYPCLELVRVLPRENPRDWPERWREAGGTIRDGRMVALRDDPIWRRISRFGSPVPPFDFNSGMGLEEVNRFDAEALGIDVPDDEDETEEKLKDESLELKESNTPKGVEKTVEKAIKKSAETAEALPAAIAENTNQVAESLGIKPGKPMTFNDANELRANPNFDPNSKEKDFRKNCQSCVVANELRRRGLDVEAMPFENAGYQREVAIDLTLPWKRKDGTRPGFSHSGKVEAGRDGIRNALNSLTRLTGRYIIVFAWNSKEGHVVTAERNRKGDLRIYDPQSGEKGRPSSKSVGKMFKGMRRAYGFNVLKVDDLELDTTNLHRLVRGSRSV